MQHTRSWIGRNNSPLPNVSAKRAPVKLHQKWTRDDQEGPCTMQPKRSKVIPYMKIVSEMVTHLLKPFSTCVAHRPAAFIKQSVSRAKSKMKPREKSNVVYKVVCLGDYCSKYYVSQSGTGTAAQMDERKRAVMRQDQLSVISIHHDATGHTYNRPREAHHPSTRQDQS